MHLSFAPPEVYIYSMARERAFMRRIYREFMEDLREILRGCGFTFKKQYGQNFISDTNLLKSIVSLSGADKNTAAVEIGCGAGTLTRELAAAAKEVVAFEIDAKLQPVLARTLAGVENAEVIFRDFLKADLPALEEKLGEYVVVANLPYYITTPLVMRFVEEAKRVKSLTVMVQDDVARRFCAEAGTPDYGAGLAIWPKKYRPDGFPSRTGFSYLSGLEKARKSAFSCRKPRSFWDVPFRRDSVPAWCLFTTTTGCRWMLSLCCCNM